MSRTPVLRGLPPEVGVIAAIAFCVALGFGIVAPAIPIYAKSFGVSSLAAGAVISVFAGMRLVTAPIAGIAIDRIGERRILTWGLIVVSISSILAGLARDFSELIILRGIGGLGSSMFTVSAMALMLKVVSANQRGRAAGAFQAGFLLGGVAGPAVGGLVLAWSVRAPFFVYAGTLLLAAAVAWRLLPSEPPGRPITVDTPDDASLQDATGLVRKDEASPHAKPITETGEETPEPPPTLAQALANRAYWAALLANLTNGFVTFGLRFSLVPLFVVEGLRADAWVVGVGFLISAATQALLLMPAGRLSDRRGRRPALLIGGALTTIGMLALALTGASWAFFVAMAISGTAAAFMGSAPAATVGDVVGASGKGIVIAVFQMTADLGAIVGPLLAGFLADSLGFGPAFAVGAAVAAMALVAAARMHETLVRKTPKS